jgi:hypothetical protein
MASQVQNRPAWLGCSLAGALAAASAHAQSIPDPSFELSGAAYQSGGTPVWQPTSINFGSPFCDGSCLGQGQPTAARSGEFWVWFGGSSNYEHATVSQSVALPSGSVLLRFYLRAYSDRAISADTLKVLVDSTVVRSINNQQLSPYIADYAQVEVDISAYAGSTRTITLDGETLAGPGLTTFFVDDVSLATTGPSCYANCDSSSASPFLNVQDFSCFLGKYAAGNAYANCDHSTAAPALNVQDFTCFLQKFAAGCSAP